MKSEKLNSGERLQSLDTLRGMDMLFIMPGNEILIGLSLILPFPFFQQIAEQTNHVAWNGCHLQDMIFPLFLFIAGISFPLNHPIIIIFIIWVFSLFQNSFFIIAKAF